MLYLLIFFITAYLTYIYYKYATFWKNRGVLSVWPWPILGNLKVTIFRERSIAYVMDDLYKAFPEKRYIGLFNTTIPALMIRDPDLIKTILVKEFETFPQHRAFIPDGIDDLWSNNLFAVRGGKKWKQIRSTMSPTFTGSKMKRMFNLMKECSEKFVNHFAKNGETLTLEMKEIFTKFTNDVILTTAFGVSCDSLENPKNEFYLLGNKLAQADGFQGLTFLLYMAVPKLIQVFNIPLFPPASKEFFVNFFKRMMAIRKKESILRPDMAHLLIEANKESTVEDKDYAKKSDKNFDSIHKKCVLSDDEIFAQAMLFFFAGFDISSTMMSHATYELALNPDVQNKLREEVDKTLEKCNGTLTYEVLNGMKYLDMVLSETLRKWPTLPIYDREAVRPFIIEPKHPGETVLKLNSGQICTIPIYAIQRDPHYFPNPEKFDPERFSDENKNNIKPFTYLPFGAGPRNCIGSRFALLEGKLILFDILTKFELVPVEKTPIPLEFSSKQFNPIPGEGFWLGFKPRDV